MTFAELFQQLNDLDEHPHIEAKAASQLGDSLLETVCAFANEPGLGGGYILAGVEPDADSLFPVGYRVAGVRDPDKLQSDVASQCATMFNRPLRPRISVEAVGGERVVVVYVPEVQPGEKPIFFKSKGLPAGAFRRIGSTDQRCTEDDLLIFYQHHQIAPFDETVILDADLSVIDADALAVYRRLRKEANPAAEELTWSDADLLRGLFCAADHNGTLRPTAAGILLFGTKFAVRRYFPMMRIDYLRVPGRQWVQDPDKRFDTVELLGPLFLTLPRAFAAVRDDLPKTFHLPPGQLTRRDIPLIPDRVVREAIVNAVMHRTYRTHGSTMIIRYENRIEIRNPGHSLKAPEKFGEPGSQTRNPRIAAVLHDTDYAEAKGSGIRVMREKMEAANLFPPHLESDRVGDQFIVHLLFHHFVDDEAIDWLAHFPDANFTPEDTRAMVFLRETGAIDNSSYRDVNKGCDTLTASGRLRRLRDLGLLDMKGKGSATYYVPTAKVLAPLNRLPALTPPRTTELPGTTASGETSATSGALPPGLEGLPPGFEDLPPGLWADVQNLGGRSDPSEVRTVIRKLCTWKELRPAQLAAILKRSQEYLQKTYIRQMVRDGELELTFPTTPAHPQQAYRAAPKKGRK